MQAVVSTSIHPNYSYMTSWEQLNQACGNDFGDVRAADGALERLGIPYSEVFVDQGPSGDWLVFWK